MEQRQEPVSTAAPALWEPENLPIPVAEVPPPIPGGFPADPLMTFPSELDLDEGTSIQFRWLVAGTAMVAVAAIAAVVHFTFLRGRLEPFTPAVTTGTLVIESMPPGATVRVNGEARGQTPLSMALAPGSYALALELGQGRREVQRTVEAGVKVFEYVELPTPPAQTGRLSVVTRPPGAEIVVDGASRGVSPLELTDLAAGAHRVTLRNAQTSVDEKVFIEPGVTSSLFVPLGTQAGAFGWVSISSPVPLQVFKDGRLIGSSEAERIMMEVGRATLEVANDALGFRVTRQVTIASGSVAKVPVDLPNGILSVNAVPWAEVWLDGKPLGETPIANLQVPIGPHELLLRHPQFGERRQTATVTLKAPLRLGVDLRK